MRKQLQSSAPDNTTKNQQKVGASDKQLSQAKTEIGELYEMLVLMTREKEEAERERDQL